MTSSQYNNIVQYTLANMTAEDSQDSAVVTRKIMNNCGVGFPHGNNLEIMLTLLSEDYMGWRSCTRTDAQQMANNGIATIGVSPERAVVIKPEGGEEINNLLVSDENSEYAATISELPLAQTYNMAFFNYSADTTTITFNRRLKNTHYIAQSGYYLYPSSYGGSKDPFHDTYFIHNTCGKTGASSSSTISRYGCAVCSEAMIAMYKGNFSNSGTYDVYNIVKEVATKGTSNTFDYDRRDYVIEYAGRQIAMNHYGRFSISNNDYDIMDQYIKGGKFLLVCFKYGPSHESQHFVLVESISPLASGLSQYLAVDPAGGKASTLKEILDARSNASLYSISVVY